MREDFYTILDCPRDASSEEIVQAYRTVVRRCHPDLNPADPDALNKFLRVQAAFEVLGNPERRQAYDPDKDRTEKPARKPKSYWPHSYRAPSLDTIVFHRTVWYRNSKRPMATTFSESESLRNVKIGTLASLVAAYACVALFLFSFVMNF